MQGSISEEVRIFNYSVEEGEFGKFLKKKMILCKIQVSPTRGVLKRPATDPDIPTTKVSQSHLELSDSEKSFSLKNLKILSLGILGS